MRISISLAAGAGDDDEGEDFYDDYETDDEIVNNVTEDKMAAYEWIREGCPPYRW